MTRPRKTDRTELPLGDDPATDDTVVVCSRCSATISDDQLENGEAITRAGRSLCPACVQALRRIRSTDPQATQDDGTDVFGHDTETDTVDVDEPPASLMEHVGIAAGSIYTEEPAEDADRDQEVPAQADYPAEDAAFAPPPVQPSAPPPPPPDKTERLIAELHHLVRELGREKFSLWNILGGMAQAGAVFVLVMLLFDPGSQTKLMWGVFVQVMALSFFTVGRK